MDHIVIVLPTYNEAENIGNLVRFIRANSNDSVTEVIVSDGGSTDNTIEVAKAAGATAVLSPEKGRAAQLNFGASLASGDVFYFIHADCVPPITFVSDISRAITLGYDLGRYRTKFLSSKNILKINAWFTRFDFFICMGGDQTLFVSRTLFEQNGGFDESMKIMED